MIQSLKDEWNVSYHVAGETGFLGLNGYVVVIILGQKVPMSKDSWVGWLRNYLWLIGFCNKSSNICISEFVLFELSRIWQIKFRYF